MGKYVVCLEGKEYQVTLRERMGGLIRFELGNEVYEVNIDPILESFQANGPSIPLPIPTARHLFQASAQDVVAAPMPGIVVSTNVKSGDPITAGQVLMVIEAMKMENNISSPRAGKIKEMLVKPGDEVTNGQALIRFES